MRNREHEVYLYYISARLFLIAVAFIIVTVLAVDLDLYVPRSFTQLTADLNNSLLQIDGKDDKFYFLQYREFYFGCAKLAIALWGYLTIRSTAKQLLPAFELNKAAHFWNIYSGEKKKRKDIIGSDICAGTILYVTLLGVSVVYGKITVVLDHMRI
jgi:hypothetical protein